MRKPKLRELGEAIRAIFKGPYTHPFPKKASPAAKTFRGYIKFQEDKCVGCGACSEVCPTEARETDDRGKVRRLVYHPERCIFCSLCVEACITKEGIIHTQVYELSKLKREEFGDVIEKELVFCELCGETITARDHLIWLAERLGELAFANPTIFLTKSHDLGGEIAPTPEEKTPYRSDHLRILCPDCRRRIYLQEEWGY
ncbi:MAG TPA: 4Fe-4S dicluster domain-containing protein [bacterium (Candidatus Stahlbacteria)]|nr:4Fe-4S dicluster domain-containing protein [Candidatus Stahlbacteria bacterium]